MMRIVIKPFILITLFFAHGLLYSQYKTSFQIEDKKIKVVVFEAEQVSLIALNTKGQSKIQFNSTSEGTYKRDLYFDYVINQDSLIIKSIYPKSLEFGDNKMTSMQEFSVSVRLSLPENLSFILDSEIASVEGSGIFKNVQINTKSGYCKLINFVGDANINTYNGKIYVKTRQAKVEAKSQAGDVNIDPALVENNQLNLRTVNGDIEVIQSE
jgi:DUF4097 and DUF4098 domain-containing protein YvlB